MAQGSTTIENYTYDAVGNRLSSLGVSPYAYNTSNQLTSYPGVTYTYDNNGNTKTKIAATGTTMYNWNYQNQLTSVVLPGSGGTVNFKYDPFGRRIQKSGPSGTTNYLYDGGNLLEEMDSSGNVLARYTQDLVVDRPLSQLRAATTSYYEADGLGSVSSLSSSAGTIANTYSYDAFGNLTASTGGITNPFRFTGREFDSETSQYFYRARYYDPNTGRFLSEDPIRFKGGINFYRYTSNNPVNLKDPSGEQTGFEEYVPSGRWPDYYQCQCSSTKKCALGSITIEVDRWGRVYGGLGGGLGIPAGYSCSCTANWIGSPSGEAPTQQQAYNFLTGLSWSGGGGFLLWYQVTWAGGQWSPGVGIGTPGASFGPSYSTQVTYQPDADGMYIGP